MEKLLSVITVTYNARDCLKDCVESVKLLKMKYDKLIEYIVIDGGSTDGTVEIIEKYRLSGVIDWYVSEKDNGIFDAMNKGINYCTGKYVIIIGSDDFLIPENFESVIECLKQKEPDVCYGNDIIVDRDTMKIVRVYNAGNYSRSKVMFGWHPPHTSTIVRRDILMKYKFDTKYKIAADTEVLWKVLLNSTKIHYENKFLSVCRTGGVSTNGIKNIVKANREVYEIAVNMHFKVPVVAVVAKLLWKVTQVIRASLPLRDPDIAFIKKQYLEGKGVKNT